MISAILVNYHTSDIITRALRSLNDSDEHIEVIIVDNSESEEEKDNLISLETARGCTLLFNEHNEGFAKACNRAYEKAKGDLILLINPDAYLVPPCLTVLKKFLLIHSRAAAVSPQMFWDDRREFFFPRYTIPCPRQDFLMSLSVALAEFGSLYSLWHRRANLKLWTTQKPVRTNNLSGGLVMLKRQAIERCGGLFDSQFFMFYEDTDLFLRLAGQGNLLYILPDAHAVHHYHHTNSKMLLMTQTRPLYFEKHFKSSRYKRLQRFIPSKQAKVATEDLRECEEPPSISVPPKLQGRFLVEWSPFHLFVPSIGHFGAGNQFRFPAAIWNQMGPGKYFCRISDPERYWGRFSSYSWEKVP